ncbi:MAG: hypothetical protein AAGL10_11575 [Pseudomonadota bacterium]
MTATIIAVSLLILQTTTGATSEAQPVETAKEEKVIEVVDDRPEKVEKITDKSHPDYVRCKSEAVIGSRAKRKRTCMTNREWALAQRRGNEASRSFVEDNQAGFGGGNN